MYVLAQIKRKADIGLAVLNFIGGGKTIWGREEKTTILCKFLTLLCLTGSSKGQ